MPQAKIGVIGGTRFYGESKRGFAPLNTTPLPLFKGKGRQGIGLYKLKGVR